MITKQEIQKIHHIYKIDDLAKEVNNSDIELEDKEQIFIWLSDRKDFIRKQKNKSRQKEKKEKRNFNIYYTENEMKILKSSQDFAKQHGKDYNIKQIIKLKSLSKDAMSQEILETQEQNTNREEQKQNLIKETLISINRIGTNINQIARDLNEKRLFMKNAYLTTDQRDTILEALEKLEEVMLNIINNSSVYDN
jgi:hypothetical protein